MDCPGVPRSDVDHGGVIRPPAGVGTSVHQLQDEEEDGLAEDRAIDVDGRGKNYRVYLVGHSVGAAIAAGYAARFPTAGVFLLSPALDMVRWREDASLYSRALVGSFARELSAERLREPFLTKDVASGNIRSAAFAEVFGGRNGNSSRSDVDLKHLRLFVLGSGRKVLRMCNGGGEDHHDSATSTTKEADVSTFLYENLWGDFENRPSGPFGTFEGEKLYRPIAKKSWLAVGLLDEATPGNALSMLRSTNLEGGDEGRDEVDLQRVTVLPHSAHVYDDADIEQILLPKMARVFGLQDLSTTSAASKTQHQFSSPSSVVSTTSKPQLSSTTMSWPYSSSHQGSREANLVSPVTTVGTDSDVAVEQKDEDTTTTSMNHNPESAFANATSRRAATLQEAAMSTGGTLQEEAAMSTYTPGSAITTPPTTTTGDNMSRSLDASLPQLAATAALGKRWGLVAPSSGGVGVLLGTSSTSLGKKSHVVPFWDWSSAAKKGARSVRRRPRSLDDAPTALEFQDRLDLLHLACLHQANPPELEALALSPKETKRLVELLSSLQEVELGRETNHDVPEPRRTSSEVEVKLDEEVLVEGGAGRRRISEEGLAGKKGQTSKRASTARSTPTLLKIVDHSALPQELSTSWSTSGTRRENAEEQNMKSRPYDARREWLRIAFAVFRMSLAEILQHCPSAGLSASTERLRMSLEKIGLRPANLLLERFTLKQLKFSTADPSGVSDNPGSEPLIHDIYWLTHVLLYHSSGPFSKVHTDCERGKLCSPSSLWNHDTKIAKKQVQLATRELERVAPLMALWLPPPTPPAVFLKKMFVSACFI